MQLQHRITKSIVQSRDISDSRNQINYHNVQTLPGCHSIHRCRSVFPFLREMCVVYNQTKYGSNRNHSRSHIGAQV